MIPPATFPKASAETRRSRSTAPLLLLCGILALPGIASALTEDEAEAASVRILVIFPIEKSTNAKGQTVATSSAERGSGFVINEEGDVVTNAHVIRGSESIWVGHRENGRDILYAVDMSTVWTSKNQDLAVIHCPELHQKPMVLTFFDPPKGADVYTIGYPGIADDVSALAAAKTLLKDSDGKKKVDVTDLLNQATGLDNFFDASVHHGEVTRLSTHPSFDEQSVKIQLIDNTVATGHGGSGGPLLNHGGEVVGVVGKSRIVSSSAIDIDRIYFAISSTELRQHLDAAHVSYTAAKEPYKEKPSTPQLQPGLKPASAPEAAPVAVVEPAHTSILGILGISTALLLAAAALVVGLMRGKRAMGTGVTSLVDEKVQRKMDAFMARMNPQQAPQSSPASPAASGAPGTAWILGGRDAQGQPIRLEFTEELLASSGEGISIGRSAGHSQLVVNDGSISKQHAQLRKVGVAFLVSDRQSANGTAVNGRVGKPFEEMPLRVGDTLTLGEVKLQFAEA